MKSNWFFSALVIAALLAGDVSAAGSAQLLDRLRANHSALVSSERDFHQRQRRGSLNAVEASDYAAYIARLHRLVAEDCAELAAVGLAPSELGCPRQATVYLAPATIDQAAEQTLDEQLATLDAELLGGLGEFDELLLREQERVRAETPMADAGEAADAGGAGAEGGDGTEGASGNPGEAEAGSSQTNSRNGQGRGAGSPRSAGQAVPPDIPDGSDDDVVARQLREAAEKETSPALKEKLWEEYRRYKKGTR